MSNYGLEIAKKFGETLPKFLNKEDAQNFYFALRNEYLKLLEELSQQSNLFKADYSIESLKKLEAWYFELYKKGTFENLGISREDFERCMSMYFGEVAHQSAGADWIVEEFAFESGKYEIGVRKNLITIMLGSFKDHFQTSNNKRMQSIYRQFKQYFES